MELKTVRYLLLCLMILVVCTTCKKEYSYEGGPRAAAGFLGGAPGTCTPVIMNGSCIQGVMLTASNTLQVEVTVTSTGTYNISTNTVNGVSFTASGNFTVTGVQNVILNGTGIPATTGTLDLIVTFGTSTCNFSITFAAAGSIATGTLGGSPGLCTPATANGIYTKGVPLASSNTLQVRVNVTTTGTYTVLTNTINGVSFSTSGTFATTGIQNVLLTGTGLPVNAGIQNFTVTWGSSSCNFSITFAGAIVADYFPTTMNSNWAYSADNGTSLDSVLTAVIPYAPSFSGNTYSSFVTNEIPAFAAQDTSYFRKTGGDYFQYIDLSRYFQFDGPTYAEYVFLKDNVPGGTTWQTPVYKGTATGFPDSVTGHIEMTIVAKAVAASVGSFNFPDVIKVHYEYYRSLPHGDPFATEERWFAKGVGLVYDNVNSTITSFQVNAVARFTVY